MPKARRTQIVLRCQSHTWPSGRRDCVRSPKPSRLKWCRANPTESESTQKNAYDAPPPRVEGHQLRRCGTSRSVPPLWSRGSGSGARRDRRALSQRRARLRRKIRSLRKKALVSHGHRLTSERKEGTDSRRGRSKSWRRPAALARPLAGHCCRRHRCRRRLLLMGTRAPRGRAKARRPRRSRSGAKQGAAR